VDSTYTDVYRETINSVVSIRVNGTNGMRGQGSGFVYDSSHLVTNEHVISNADEVTVRFRTGDWRTAEVVGTDVYSDLGVLRVTDRPPAASPLTVIQDAAVVGQKVLAIGNPFGLSGSVSAGIISGVDRTLPAANNFSIPDAIQTDAAVNPGNSGGPLVDMSGDVLGVINSGAGENIGFAISASLTRRIVPTLIDDGTYEHSYMGILLTDVTPTIASANNLASAGGVYVDGVRDDGPSKGVLQGSDSETTVGNATVPVGGDVIVQMGGREIQTRQELSTFLALETQPGDTISVTVLRDGKRKTVSLTLGARPTEPLSS
jgi:S1-C subfamily serine protease